MRTQILPSALWLILMTLGACGGAANITQDQIQSYNSQLDSLGGELESVVYPLKYSLQCKTYQEALRRYTEGQGDFYLLQVIKPDEDVLRSFLGFPSSSRSLHISSNCLKTQVAERQGSGPSHSPIRENLTTANLSYHPMTDRPTAYLYVKVSSVVANYALYDPQSIQGPLEEFGKPKELQQLINELQGENTYPNHSSRP